MIASGNAVLLWWVLSIAVLPECAVLVSVHCPEGNPTRNVRFAKQAICQNSKELSAKFARFVCSAPSPSMAYTHSMHMHMHITIRVSSPYFCCSVLFRWQRWAEMVLAFASALSSSDSNSVLLFLVMTSLPVCTMTLSL